MDKTPHRREQTKCKAPQPCKDTAYAPHFYYVLYNSTTFALQVALAISLTRKDTLQTETSDVELDEIQVFVSVVVLFFQGADSIALRNG